MMSTNPAANEIIRVCRKFTSEKYFNEKAFLSDLKEWSRLLPDIDRWGVEK